MLLAMDEDREGGNGKGRKKLLRGGFSDASSLSPRVDKRLKSMNFSKTFVGDKNRENSLFSYKAKLSFTLRTTFQEKRALECFRDLTVGTIENWAGVVFCFFFFLQKSKKEAAHFEI